MKSSLKKFSILVVFVFIFMSTESAFAQGWKIITETSSIYSGPFLTSSDTKFSLNNNVLFVNSIDGEAYDSNLTLDLKSKSILNVNQGFVASNINDVERTVAITVGDSQLNVAGNVDFGTKTLLDIKATSLASVRVLGKLTAYKIKLSLDNSSMLIGEEPETAIQSKDYFDASLSNKANLQVTGKVSLEKGANLQIATQSEMKIDGDFDVINSTSNPSSTIVVTTGSKLNVLGTTTIRDGVYIRVVSNASNPVSIFNMKNVNILNGSYIIADNYSKVIIDGDVYLDGSSTSKYSYLQARYDGELVINGNIYAENLDLSLKSPQFVMNYKSSVTGTGGIATVNGNIHFVGPATWEAGPNGISSDPIAYVKVMDFGSLTLNGTLTLENRAFFFSNNDSITKINGTNDSALNILNSAHLNITAGSEVIVNGKVLVSGILAPKINGINYIQSNDKRARITLESSGKLTINGQLIMDNGAVIYVYNTIDPMQDSMITVNGQQYDYAVKLLNGSFRASFYSFDSKQNRLTNLGTMYVNGNVLVDGYGITYNSSAKLETNISEMLVTYADSLIVINGRVDLSNLGRLRAANSAAIEVNNVNSPYALRVTAGGAVVAASAGSMNINGNVIASGYFDVSNASLPGINRNSQNSQVYAVNSGTQMNIDGSVEIFDGALLYAASAANLVVNKSVKAKGSFFSNAYATNYNSSVYSDSSANFLIKENLTLEGEAYAYALNKSSFNVYGNVSLSKKSVLYSDKATFNIGQTGLFSKLSVDNSEVYATNTGVINAKDIDLTDNSLLRVENTAKINASKEINADNSRIWVKTGGELTASLGTLNGSSLYSLYGKNIGNIELNGLSMLAGTGNVFGDVKNNSGIISAGDESSHRGSLSISGNYTQMDNALIRTYIHSVSDTTVLYVENNASIASGSVVDAIFTEGFVPQAGDEYLFLVASNINNYKNFGLKYNIAIRNGYLTIGMKNNGVSDLAFIKFIKFLIDDVITDSLTYNQTSVLNNLKLIDASVPDNSNLKTSIELIAGYYGRTLALNNGLITQELRDALDSLSGVIHTATLRMHLDNPQNVGFGNIDFSMVKAHSNRWIKPVLQFSNVKTDGNAKAYENIYFGLTGGAHKVINNNLQVGYIVGIGRSSLKQCFQDKDKAKSVELLAGVYSGLRLDNIVLKGYMGYGISSVNVSRTVSMEQSVPVDLNSKYLSSVINLAFDASYSIKGTGLGFVPNVGVEYRLLMRKGFKEIGDDELGSVALDVKNSGQGFMNVSIGLDYVLISKNITYKISAGYKRYFGITYTQMNATFLGNTEPFNIRGIDLSKDTVYYGAMLQGKLDSGATVSIDYKGEYGKNILKNNFTLGISAQF